MKKAKFIKYIEEIKSQRKTIEKIDALFKELDPDFGGFYLGRYEALAVDMLKDIMHDESDWIGYWMYELDYGKEYKKGSVTFNDVNIPLKTPEDLYNILTNK